MVIEFTDIVFPKGNEKEFIETAKKLNIKNLIFCYDLSLFKDNDFKGSSIKKAVLINSSDIRKAKGLSLPLLCNRNDRFLFEQKYQKPLVLFGIEGIAKYDSLHSRHSGLNHILCSLAEKNNIVLGISFSQLLNADSFKRAQLIGRVAQNVRLARKYKMKIKLGSFARAPFEMRADNDLMSLGKVLGMNGSEVKRALEYNLD